MIPNSGLCRCLGDRPSGCRLEDRKRKAHSRDRPGPNSSRRLPTPTDYRGHQGLIQCHPGSGTTVPVLMAEGRMQTEVLKKVTLSRRASERKSFSGGRQGFKRSNAPTFKPQRYEGFTPTSATFPTSLARVVGRVRICPW